MPSVPLHPPTPERSIPKATANPLPQLLQTPSGLAILELQGTINMPAADFLDGDEEDEDNEDSSHHQTDVAVGRLVFPLYSVHDPPESTAWMERVHLYVGRHQRLTGEVKKLPNPMAVIRRKHASSDAMDLDGASAEEKLEIVEIVRWKILFSQRPEPVSEE
ncbi:MAG: hypothetical protein M1819_002161 [Sarea resinae]|nr:MAG: hypothetical protein M1819_002161 [Sarea resinae]